ncbi:minichromosome maintenance protein MCM, partial [Candidatus Pacearchaeota archaeon]|nr:minichromosome maintenance protein MCM [Candidatus Pacearchaeota archaeon]
MSSYDNVILTLRDSGKKEWTRTEISEIISEKFGQDKKSSLTSFDSTVSRTDYIKKLGGTPAKYSLSKMGVLRADKLKKEHNDKLKIDKVLDDFIDTYYPKEISLAVKDGEEFLKIDYKNLWQGAHDFAIKLLEEPDECLQKLNQTLRNHHVCFDSETPPVASIYNTGDVMRVEDIKTRHINKFVEVEGRITTQSIARTKVLTAAFQCQRCDHITHTEQEMERFVEPFECQNDICGRKGPFKLLPEPESVTVDGQVITLTSLRGQVSIDVRLLGSFCEPPWVRDGKVVRVCGIVRSYQTISRTGTKSNNFDWIIDTVSIELAEDSNTEPPTDEEKQMFDEWAKNPQDLRNRLISSVAPNIYGSLLEKDIAILTLFSDWEWNNDPKDVLEHSSIHALFIGDP